MRNGKAHFVALVAAIIALAAGVITRMMAQETRTAEPVRQMPLRKFLPLA